MIPCRAVGVAGSPGPGAGLLLDAAVRHRRALRLRRRLPRLPQLRLQPLHLPRFRVQLFRHLLIRSRFLLVLCRNDVVKEGGTATSDEAWPLAGDTG